MIKTKQLAMMKNSQRNKVYDNLSALMEWISYSIQPEVNMILDSIRSVLAVSHRKLTLTYLK